MKFSSLDNLVSFNFFVVFFKPLMIYFYSQTGPALYIWFKLESHIMKSKNNTFPKWKPQYVSGREKTTRYIIKIGYLAINSPFLFLQSL